MHSRSGAHHHDSVRVHARARENIFARSNRHTSSKNSGNILDCVMIHALTLSSRDSISRF